MPEQPLHIVTCGLNHRTAPIEVREQVAFRAQELDAALHALLERPLVSEAAILSTCNRAELYVASEDPAAAGQDLTAFLSDYHRVPREAVTPHLYHHADLEAARHLFRVASGIDSLVLGESEILAQVKEALHQADSAGTTRALLNELFQRSLHIGKVARTNTAIGRGRVSVSSAAVDLARNVFGDLNGRRTLIVGAGEMAQQTLEHLVAAGVKSVLVANRTFERAEELAQQHGGRAVRFDSFTDHLADADVIVSASAAPHPILTVDKLRPALERRHGRPLFIVDIAVPRDVESSVGDLPNVYLFDIDDLEQIADTYRRERERETVRVEALIEEETHRFMRWLDSRAMAPLIRELRDRTDALREAECDRFLRRLPDLTDTEREVVRQMMRSFANKLMHAPSEGLRELAVSDPDGEATTLARRLFGLDRTEEPR